MTRVVEILSIRNDLDKTSWSEVKQLPCAVYSAIPLIVHDNLYIAGGFEKYHQTTCKIVSASLSKLYKSDGDDTGINQVWNKLLDMPYSTFSINHYRGRLITFTGVFLGKEPALDIPIHKFYIYNPSIESWDYIAPAYEGYIWGRSVHIKDDTIFVIGGTTGTIYRGEDENLVKMCLMLSFSHRGRKIPHDAF